MNPAIVFVAAVGLLIAGAVLWGLFTYNALVRGGLQADEAWSTVAVQLKRRAALVPNLAESVGAYAAHERDTLTEIARARRGLEAADSAPAAEEANAALGRAVGRLLAVAESYPDLKASANFIALQKELADLEEKIAFARQFYNSTVLELNGRIETLPSSMVATMMNLKARRFFEMDEPADTPRVRFAQGAAGAAVS